MPILIYFYFIQQADRELAAFRFMWKKNVALPESAVKMISKSNRGATSQKN